MRHGNDAKDKHIFDLARECGARGTREVGGTALLGKQKLGNMIGMAYALDALGWLSAKTSSPERTAWTLGAVHAAGVEYMNGQLKDLAGG